MILLEILKTKLKIINKYLLDYDIKTYLYRFYKSLIFYFLNKYKGFKM